MERARKVKGRSRRRKSMGLQSWYKVRRIVAFILSFALVMSSAGGPTVTALAGEETADREEFRIHVEDIQTAVEKALSEGNAVAEEDALEIAAKNKRLAKEYKALLDADGTLFEIFPEMETVKDVYGIELRVFLRLEEDDEQGSLLFLFVNVGEETVKGRLNIDGKVSAYTTVKPYDEVFDEEAEEKAVYVSDIVGPDQTGEAGAADTASKPSDGSESEPSDGTTAGSGDADGRTEDGSMAGSDDADGRTEDGSMAGSGDADGRTDDEAKSESDGGAGRPDAGSKGETGDGSGRPGDGPKGESGDGSGKTDDGSASEPGDGGGRPDAGSKTESGHGAGKPDRVSGTSGAAVGAGDGQGGKDDQTAFSVTGRVDVRTDSPADPDAQGQASVALAISWNEIRMVSAARTDLDGAKEALDAPEAEGAADPEGEEPEQEPEAADEGAAEEEGEKELEQVTPEQEVPEQEDDAEKGAEAPVDRFEEDPDKEEPEEAAPDKDAEAIDMPGAADDVSDEGEPKEEGREGAETPKGSKVEAAADEEEDESLGEEEEEASEEDLFEKNGTLKGRVYGLAALEGCMTVKAFAVSLSELGIELADLKKESHTIIYTIDPVGTATLVKAPEQAADEETVVFGVKPEAGHEIVEVTANGEALELAGEEEAASPSDAETVVSYYTIPEVLEDQVVEIFMIDTEEGARPAFRASKTLNGVTITVSAEEGIIPKGTELEVAEVTEELEEAAKEKVESQSTEEVVKKVSSVLAYDIDLMLNGEQLDDSWAENGCVEVTFSGSRIEQKAKESDDVEVLAVAENQTAANNKGRMKARSAYANRAAANVIQLEKVDEVIDEKTEKRIFFVATQLSAPRAIAFTKSAVLGNGEILVYFYPNEKFGGHWEGGSTDPKPVRFKFDKVDQTNKYKIYKCDPSEFPDDPIMANATFAGWTVQTPFVTPPRRAGLKKGDTIEVLIPDDGHIKSVLESQEHYDPSIWDKENKHFTPVVWASYDKTYIAESSATPKAEENNSLSNEDIKNDDSLTQNEKNKLTTRLTEAGDVAANKSAKWIDYDNGIAQITLKVKGIPKTTNADVVIVLDKSGSMTPRYCFSAEERMIFAKEAALNAVEELLSGENNNRVAFTSFYGKVGPSVPFQTSETKEKLVNVIKAIDGDEGYTKYDRGLGQAKAYFDAAKIDGREKYIIFISDGEPDSGCGGTDIAKELRKMGVHIYTFGIGVNGTAQEALEKLSYATERGEASGEFVRVDDPEEIGGVIKAAVGDIKKTGTKAYFTDTISTYYTVVDPDDQADHAEMVGLLGKDGAEAWKRQYDEKILQISRSGSGEEIKEEVKVDIQNIPSELTTYCIYVRLKPGYMNTKADYNTNEGITLTYTPVDGTTPTTIPKGEIGEPKLPRDKGTIKVTYYRVDEDGNFLDENGVRTDDPEKAIIQTTVVPSLKVKEGGSTYIADKDGTLNNEVGKWSFPAGYQFYEKDPQYPKQQTVTLDFEKNGLLGEVKFKVTAVSKIKKEVEEDKNYGLGDRITYKITVTNGSPYPRLNVKVKDTMRYDGKDGEILSPEFENVGPQRVTWDPTVSEFNIPRIEANGEITISYTYAVKSDDIGKKIWNVAAIGDMPSNEVIVDTEGWEVTKTVDKAEAKVNDDLRYEITVTNTGSVALTKKLTDVFKRNDVAVAEEEQLTLSVSEADKGKYNEEAKIVTLEAGETVTLTSQYTVKDGDKDLVNAVWVDDPKISVDPEKPGRDPDAEVETKVENWAVTKTVVGMSGTIDEETNEQNAKPGDELVYTITVTNTGELKIEKDLADVFRIDGIPSTPQLTLEKASAAGIYQDGKLILNKDEAIVLKARYKVKATDNVLLNTVTVGSDPDKKEDEVETKVDPTEAWEVHKSVSGMTGIVDDKVGRSANVGDELLYEITVVNTGNATIEKPLTDVFQVDGVEWSLDLAQKAEDGHGSYNQETGMVTLEKGQIVVLTASYTVKSSDSVLLNTVTVGDKKDEVETKVEDKPDWAVDKTVAGMTGENGMAKVGDTLVYMVTVTNTGNVSIEKLLTDMFTVDGAKAVLPLAQTEADGQGTYDPESGMVILAKGQNVVLTASYTVTSTDNVLVNTAAVEDKEKTVETKVEGTPAWTVDKTVEGMTGEDGKAKVGDILTYTITVSNIGNEAIEKRSIDIFQVDGVIKELILEKAGGEGSYIDGMVSLGKGEELILTSTYLVEETDSKLVNTVKVGTEPEDPEKTVETEVEPRPDFDIKKEITNTAQAADGKYAVGETIAYKITVTNTGNVTFDVFPVTDQTSGSGAVVIEKVERVGADPTIDHQVDGNVVRIRGLRPGETAEIDCTYIAVPADNGKTVINTAIATYEGQEERDEVPADVKETEPERTPGGGGGSNTSSRRDRDRSTPVADEDVPLVSIDPENVPLADLPADPGTDIMELLDEDIPLAGLAKTGDNSVSIGFLVGMMVVSLLGAFGAAKKRKEDREA